MAKPPLRVCGAPGCNRLTRESRCPAHAKRQRQPDNRGSAASRGYDSQWRRFRAAYLREHPLCEDCMELGRTTAAHHLHHLEKLTDAPERRLDPSNVRPLCEACHNRRTARGE